MSDQIPDDELRERLTHLSPHALVAFASRCARRVQPLFDDSAPGYDHRSRIDKAIESAEFFAKGFRYEQPEFTIGKFSSDATESVRAAIAQSGMAAGAAAAAAALAAESAYTDFAKAVFATGEAVGAASTALVGSAEHESAKHAVLSDLRLLEDLDNKDPIDPSESGPLGPLWPDGVPAWFKSIPVDIDEWKTASQAVRHGTFAGGSRYQRHYDDEKSVTVYVDPGAVDAVTIRDLYLALSTLYEAHGGSGLQIIKHQRRTLVGEEVPV